jgi:hypothetical protein
MERSDAASEFHTFKLLLASAGDLSRRMRRRGMD